jgi:hypothetical protein
MVLEKHFVLLNNWRQYKRLRTGFISLGIKEGENIWDIKEYWLLFDCND